MKSEALIHELARNIMDPYERDPSEENLEAQRIMEQDEEARREREYAEKSAERASDIRAAAAQCTQ